jgi:hypothetical protein
MRKKNLGQYNYIKKLMAMANKKKKACQFIKSYPLIFLKSLNDLIW